MQINNNSNISFGIKFSNELEDKFKKDLKSKNRFIEESVHRQKLLISSYGEDNFEMIVRESDIDKLELCIVDTYHPSVRPYKLFETSKRLLISKFVKIHKEDIEKAQETLKCKSISQPLIKNIQKFR